MIDIKILAIILNFVAAISLLTPQIFMKPIKLSSSPHNINPDLLRQLRLERKTAFFALILLIMSMALQSHVMMN